MSAVRIRRNAIVAVAATGTLLLPTCGSEEPAPQPSVSEPASEPSTLPTHRSADLSEPYRELVEMSSEEDLRGEVQEPVEVLFDRHYVRLGDYEVIDDEVLRFHFYMGNFDCYGVQHSVEENEDEVAVAVITGTRTGVDACTDDAALGAVDVQLDDDLGNRDVVDLSERL